MQKSQNKQDKEHGEDQQAPKPHVLEWVIGGCCAVLVLAMIGYILYQAVGPNGAPKPDLDVIVEQTEKVRGGFRIAFRAVNRGDATAGSVKIEGRLMNGPEAVETSDITLDYVPADSEVRGGLLFSHDPGQYQVELEAKSYREL